MPLPSPAPRPPTPKTRVVVASTTKRDVLIAVAIGAAVLGLVLLGISGLSGMPGKPSTNLMAGRIVAKHDAGTREQEISVGKKGLTAKEIDDSYSFEVKTAEGRVYEVPVPKVQYEMYKVGAEYRFIRPVSEQR